MSQTTFTFRVDEELKGAFAEIAEAQDRSAAQLMRKLMRDAVEERQEAKEHDEWFRAEVRQALREADDPNAVWIPHEEVKARWLMRRSELLRRIEDESA